MHALLEQPYFGSPAGPPPPSPPASVEGHDDADIRLPPLPASSRSEPPATLPGREPIVQPPRPKSVHRLSTESRVDHLPPPIPLPSPVQTPQLPPPIPLPEPRSITPPLPELSLAPAVPLVKSPSAATAPMVAPAPATRRHTTGSTAKHHHHRFQNFGAQFHPTEDVTALGDAALALQSDIAAASEQVRRERQSKRAKQQAQAEAEAALTRTDTRGTRGTREDDDSKPLVGNLIGEGHVNYVLMYNMLTGIRIGVSRWQAKLKKPLTDDDFTGKHKYSFDIIGNELTPSAKYDFKFKDYAPWVFRTLREDVFRLDPADYLLSLTAKYILSELGSPGKSGSFFYFSRDYRFIIKTIRHSEHQFLLKTLKEYYHHVKDNPHTLLSRFYGLHRVKLPRGKKIHFVIMNNLFPPHRDIHETYDLKGSTFGREYPEEKAEKNPRAVLKDLNWINRNRELELGPEKRALLTEQLRRDVAYLESVDVMDYSLLVGIHNMKRGNRDNVRRNTLKVFEPELPQGPRMRQSVRGTKTPEAIAMRRAMRSSDPKAFGSSSLGTTTGTSTTVPVPGGALHAPRPLAGATPSSSQTTNHPPSPQLFHHPHNSHLQPATIQEEGESPILFLDQDTTTDRQYFIFYQDEGGLKATDEENKDMSTIYYLGVIDILTPYGVIKKAERWWKCVCVGYIGGIDRRKISQVPPKDYGKRFVAFMKAIMRGGEGGIKFK